MTVPEYIVKHSAFYKTLEKNGNLDEIFDKYSSNTIATNINELKKLFETIRFCNITDNVLDDITIDYMLNNKQIVQEIIMENNEKTMDCYKFMFDNDDEITKSINDIMEIFDIHNNLDNIVNIYIKIKHGLNIEITEKLLNNKDMVNMIYAIALLYCNYEIVNICKKHLTEILTGKLSLVAISQSNFEMFKYLHDTDKQNMMHNICFIQHKKYIRGTKHNVSCFIAMDKIEILEFLHKNYYIDFNHHYVFSLLHTQDCFELLRDLDYFAYLRDLYPIFISIYKKDNIDALRFVMGVDYDMDTIKNIVNYMFCDYKTKAPKCVQYMITFDFKNTNLMKIVGDKLVKSKNDGLYDTLLNIESNVIDWCNIAQENFKQHNYKNFRKIAAAKKITITDPQILDVIDAIKSYIETNKI